MIRLLWKPAAMLLAFAAVALLLRQSGFDPREAMASAGAHGPAAFVLVGSLACAAAIPRQVVALAGGYAFGFWQGAALTLLVRSRVARSISAGRGCWVVAPRCLSSTGGRAAGSTGSTVS